MRIGVTALCGLDTAGRRAVLHGILDRPGRQRLGVVVEPLPAGGSGEDAGGLAERLRTQIADLVLSGRYDHLLVDLAPGTEPLDVVEAFGHWDDAGDLETLATLDTLVTVTDATTFLTEFARAEELSDRGIPVAAGDDRLFIDVLVDQVETADVVVLRLDEDAAISDAHRLQEVVEHLNPHATVMSAPGGRISAAETVATGRFDPRHTTMPGWARQLFGGEGVDSGGRLGWCLYRARRPFHPGRLLEQLDRDWPGVLRSKGFVWLASRPDHILLWSQAGASLAFQPAGYWLASERPEAWDEFDGPEREILQRDWDPYYGDRQQEIAFLGADLDAGEIRRALDRCLLDDEELSRGEQEWRRFADPFPSTAP